jgi:hypothetical protein
MDALATLLGLGLLLAALVVVAGLFLSRQRTLTHRVGSFGCLLRQTGPRGWTPGVAQYGSGRLLWWRSLSLAPRPAHTWPREKLEVLERSPYPGRDELGRPLVAVRCRIDDEEFTLSMSAAAYAGLVSWLEAGPRCLRAL